MAAFANTTVRIPDETIRDRRGTISSWTRGRPWTRPEEESLVDAASTQTILEIAAALGRSEASVRLKLKSLGYNLSDLSGFKVKDLAALLGVTIRQVRRWRQKGYLRGLNGRITEESFSKFCRAHADKIPYSALAWDAKVWLRGFGYRPPETTPDRPSMVIVQRATGKA
jgi:hypothetical protein